MIASQGKLWRYYTLLFALSVPFWLLGAMVGRLALPINLPIAALMAALPALVTLWLSWRDGGWSRVFELIARIVDFARISHPGWIWIAVLLMPIALVVAYGLQLLAGDPLPSFALMPTTLGAFLILFTLGGIGEELGWQGFVYPAMRVQWDALTSSLVIGSFWAIWHVVPFLQAGRSSEWILWQCLTMLPLRIITVWLFLNAGESVAVAILFHAMSNVAQFSFPAYGSHYEPLTCFVVLTAIAILIVATHGAQLQRGPASQTRTIPR